MVLLSTSISTVHLTTRNVDVVKYVYHRLSPVLVVFDFVPILREERHSTRATANWRVRGIRFGPLLTLGGWHAE